MGLREFWGFLRVRKSCIILEVGMLFFGGVVIFGVWDGKEKGVVFRDFIFFRKI